MAFTKEQHKVWAKAYREKNRDRINAYQKAYKQGIGYDKFNGQQRFYTQLRRARCMELLGNRCCKCGFDNVLALQFDHVSGGGTKERKKAKSNRALYNAMYQEILEGNVEGHYQLLCANCNWIKRTENKEV